MNITILHHKIAMVMNLVKVQKHTIENLETEIKKVCTECNIQFSSQKIINQPNWLTFNGMDWQDLDHDLFAFSNKYEYIKELIAFRVDVITAMKENNEYIEKTHAFIDQNSVGSGFVYPNG